jgi:predicted RNase H-like nuclease
LESERRLAQLERSYSGVDGCRGGWLVARCTGTRRLRIVDVTVVATFADVLAHTKACAAVAVDIPIGLSDGEPRKADIEARRLLGRPRASSVFPAPVRTALTATTYREACDLSYRACGRKLTRQTWNILPKVREADDAMTSALQRRVVEAHPEVSFRALAGGRTMAHRKKSSNGREERLETLAKVFAGDLASLDPLRGAATDDLLDACAVAWTAMRLAQGRAARLPAEPRRDIRGLRMEIVY